MKNLINHLLIITILITSPKISASRSNYTIQEIKTNAGIFYQNQGEAYIYDNYITLCSYKNLTHYQEKLSQIIQIFENSKTICDPDKHLDTTLSIYCNNSVSIIQSQIPTLYQKFASITHLTGIENDTTSRRRRGIINGIGTGLKWLFGTPDAEDAEQFKASIDSLFSQNYETHKLMKQQVHVLISAINAYNSSVEEFKRNTNILNNNMKEIQGTNVGIVKSLHSMSETTTAIKHVTLLTQLILQLSEEFNVIINAILFAKMDILHPSIINPNELRKELEQIKLASNLQLPIPLNSNNMHLYLTIIKISVALRDDNTLIYFLRIPTPYQEKYGLHHMLPFPRSKHSRMFSFIIPQEPYLLINLPATEYTLLDSLAHCKKLHNIHICKTYTKSKVFADVSCEVQLKTRPELEKLPINCVTKTIKAEMEVWQKIDLNEWLFSLSEKKFGTISCIDSNVSDPPETIKVQGAGTLRLRGGCQVNFGKTTLQAYSEPRHHYTHFVPSVDILTDMRCQADEENLLKLDVKSIAWKGSSLDELRVAKNQLEIFEKDVEKVQNQPKLNSGQGQEYLIHLLVTWCLPIVIGGVIFVVVCYLKCALWGRGGGGRSRLGESSEIHF